jgi:serine O-acetyltransferase
MYPLRQLLSNDLARQYSLEGKLHRHPGCFRILCRLLHPRFLPIVLYRASRASKLARIPLLPHVFGYLNLMLFGMDVTATCEIGPGIFFPHTSGIVIGASSIGSNVTLYQGVTLGAKQLDMHFDPSTRPTIGNNVTLGSGAKILGGITIGDNVKVGANSVVVHSIGPNRTVIGIPAREVFASGKPS